MTVRLVVRSLKRLWVCSRALPLSPLRTPEALPAVTGGQGFLMRVKSPGSMLGYSLSGARNNFGNLISAPVVSISPTTKGNTLYLLTDNSVDLTFAELTLGEVIAPEVTVMALTKIGSREIGDSYASWTTVCFTPSNPFHKYTVWTVVARPSGWERFHGDYCDTLAQAVACYTERGGK
jgi:hypothetical protein